MDVLQKYQNEARGVNFNPVLSTTLCSYKLCYLYTVVITIEYKWYKFWEINRIYDGVEAETRKSQASFQII